MSKTFSTIRIHKNIKDDIDLICNNEKLSRNKALQEMLKIRQAYKEATNKRELR
jgi:hypothetical protein